MNGFLMQTLKNHSDVRHWLTLLKHLLLLRGSSELFSELMNTSIFHQRLEAFFGIIKEKTQKSMDKRETLHLDMNEFFRELSCAQLCEKELYSVMRDEELLQYVV